MTQPSGEGVDRVFHRRHLRHSYIGIHDVHPMSEATLWHSDIGMGRMAEVRRFRDACMGYEPVDAPFWGPKVSPHAVRYADAGLCPSTPCL